MEDSYTEPYQRVLAEAITAWEKASTPIKGAEARTRAAKTALDQLKAFNDEIAHRLEKQLFNELPTLKASDPRIDAMYSLTVGPYRGVFIVRPDGTEVIALAFSKAPHDPTEHLIAAARRYFESGGGAGEEPHG